MPAKPKSPFPNPAAVLPGEADILANVIANLADHDAKLVYADWLEERDDPRGPQLRKFVNAYRHKTDLPDISETPEPWRNLLGLSLITQVLQIDPFGVDADLLLTYARPALTFESEITADDDIPVGGNKLGGWPDLPDYEQWPETDGRPLAFLAQFDLSDLTRGPVCRDLPPGLLSVFFDPTLSHYPPDHRVLHVPQGVQIIRRKPHAELAQVPHFGDLRYRSASLAYTETLTLPDTDSPWYEIGGPLLNVGRSRELCQEPGLGHRLLGYSHPLQSDAHRRLTVRHLLTINSDDNPAWMWSDSGLLYFMIDEDDLRHHRFNRVVIDMQCC